MFAYIHVHILVSCDIVSCKDIIFDKGAIVSREEHGQQFKDVGKAWSNTSGNKEYNNSVIC